MTVKFWPSKNRMPSYRDLTDPIKKIFYQLYTVKPKEIKKTLSYDGFLFGVSEKEFPPPNKIFSKKYLEYYLTKGYRGIDFIIFTIFWLGVEFGRRTQKKEKPTLNEEILIRLVQKQAKEIKELKTNIECLENKNFSANNSREELPLQSKEDHDKELEVLNRESSCERISDPDGGKI